MSSQDVALEKAPAFRRCRRLVGCLVLAASFGLLLGALTHLSIMRFTGDAWWFGTILLFAPRWVLLPPLGLIALASAVWRPRMLWINLATVLLIVWPTMGYQFAIGSVSHPGEEPGRIKFMTSNIGYAQIELIQREIERVQPDVVVLQESTPAKAAEIFDESWQIAGGSGVCIAGRFPVRDSAAVRADQVNRWSNPALGAKIESPAGAFWLVGVHLETPRWGLEELAVTRRGLEGIDELEANTARRAHESQAVREWVDQLPGPVVVTGDFNMPVDSLIYSQCWSSFNNAFSQLGRGFGYSKFTRWHGIRIDHFLVDDRWRLQKVEVGNSIGGDHRPLIVTAFLEIAP